MKYMKYVEAAINLLGMAIVFVLCILNKTPTLIGSSVAVGILVILFCFWRRGVLLYAGREVLYIFFAYAFASEQWGENSWRYYLPVVLFILTLAPFFICAGKSSKETEEKTSVWIIASFVLSLIVLGLNSFLSYLITCHADSEGFFEGERGLIPILVMTAVLATVSSIFKGWEIRVICMVLSLWAIITILYVPFGGHRLVFDQAGALSGNTITMANRCVAFCVLTMIVFFLMNGILLYKVATKKRIE